MLLSFSALFLLACCWGNTTPPRQTPYQKQLRESALSMAPAQSAAATPLLLEALDKPIFRAQIKQLPIASLPASELLVLLRQGFQISKIVHTVPAYPSQGIGTEADLDALMNSTYMFNGWVANALNLTLISAYQRFQMDFAEGNAVGYGPFPNLTCDLPDCQERPLYCAPNSMQLGAGLPMFGGITFVMRQDYVRDLIVLLPMDSGNWVDCCIQHKQCATGCFAWSDYMVGSMDHMDHMIMRNLQYWHSDVSLQMLAQTFQRLYSPVGHQISLGPETFYSYIEAMVVGTVVFPDGVSHIIAVFDAFFGSTRAEKLQAWATKMGFGLVWANGLSDNNQTQSGTYSQAFLDPIVPFASNVTMTSEQLATFHNLWNSIKEATKGGAFPRKTQWWREQWDAYWPQVPPNLRVNAMSVYSCANSSACIGMDDSLHCLCPSSSSS